MVNFKENEELKTLNHSCAHLMAQAIKHLYPQAKFWVGPVVAEGFYYDVDLGEDVIRDEDIEKIEKEMKKIAKSGKETQWRVCIRGGWEPSGTAEHPPDQEKRYRADPFAGWHTDGSSDRNSGSRRSKK